MRSQPSLKASAESEDAAGVAEPRRAGGTDQHPPPTSHLPSLLETATTGPSGCAQGQPRCTLCGNTASSPRVKGAFHQPSPACLKMERGLGKSWSLDGWVLTVHLFITTAVSTGSLAAAPPGKGEVCKAPSQANVSSASL